MTFNSVLLGQVSLVKESHLSQSHSPVQGQPASRLGWVKGPAPLPQGGATVQSPQLQSSWWHQPGHFSAATELHFTLQLLPLPNPTHLTPSQVLPLSASPNKLPAQSETVFQETPPKTGVEAGFKPRHSRSRVHACNQHSEIVTVNADSEKNFGGSFPGFNRLYMEKCLDNN